jgi:hypothetical protein
MTHVIPAELAKILEEIVPPGEASGGARGGAFRHRQHIHLAFIAVRRYRAAQAADRISAWLRHLTAHAPQKYNATITRAWTEIVGYHIAAVRYFRASCTCRGMPRSTTRGKRR